MNPFDVNIRGKPLFSPHEIHQRLPASAQDILRVSQQRQTIHNILSQKDDRLLVIVGPCAVQRIDATLEYASRLGVLAKEVSDRLFIVMRTYIEKSRSADGWKGFLYDRAHHTLEERLAQSRQLFLALVEQNVPIAMEFLDPMAAEYVSDLVAWGCIGARTVQSSIHRELASRLPMPVGMKNSPDGSLEPAIFAIATAQKSHQSFGITNDGKICEVTSAGNSNAHLVLRGGVFGPNFRSPQIQKAVDLLRSAGLSEAIVVDCSHGNSQRKWERQTDIFHEILDDSLKNPHSPVRGLMLESFLLEGTQEILLPHALSEEEREEIRYGSSLVDGCLGWEATAELLISAHEKCCRKKESAAT